MLMGGEDYRLPSKGEKDKNLYNKMKETGKGKMKDSST